MLTIVLRHSNFFFPYLKLLEFIAHKALFKGGNKILLGD